MTDIDAVSRNTSEQIERANATDRTPVVFVHGLWLLPSSWDRWAAFFDEAGYAAITPGWPDDPETVEEAMAGGGRHGARVRKALRLVVTAGAR